ALLVAAGILLSRIVGLVRQRVFAHYFGISEAADAFSAAFRIPNFLQNLFGEGALSASFIPVYAALLARDEKEEAQRLASAILFPGAAIFVLFAWCIGILNSHRRFFLSYAAPVMWNVAMIGALLLYGGAQSVGRLAVTLAWASVLGAVLQFAVQLPVVLPLVG